MPRPRVRRLPAGAAGRLPAPGGPGRSAGLVRPVWRQPVASRRPGLTRVYNLEVHAEYVYHVSRVGLLGTTLHRNEGLALYGADAFSLSLAAAVGEEALWRGVLQNELENALGPRQGLSASAALFGLAHLVDLDGSLSLGRAAFGTLAGWYLGSLFQHDRHRLERPVAAHFWYDFTVMFCAFLLDPDDNPLQVSVSFRY